ncbi:adenosine 3'-phospho 5'-phosphosulfate transporter 2 isoform X2 [Leptinotarsa decemlineata]|uniref:adenosine 3'-phospho 5'-phosphosulfate transporter 2 isoform X2 n=1 Tax=Leptinotarsa decemlineata TaxID=7539 RepID=UPI003D3096FA
MIRCLDLNISSKNREFLVLSSAVFLCFLLYGYIQELLFTIEGFGSFGWFLTLVQFGLYSIFGLVETRIRRIGSRKIPIQTYLLLALLTLGTMGFSNASLGYLNYPTQVIFKCCKLIPVLAGGILIQGKQYGPLDFMAAVLMCVGLTTFILADSHVQPSFNTKGVIMISVALLCDAIIGNVQEKSMKSYGAANAEVDPKRSYGYTFIFSLTGYLGIQIVLTLVRRVGAFAAVTVTTCRKAVTIVISFIFFSKPFTFQYLWSGLLVLTGIYLNVFSKNHPFSMVECEMLIKAYLKSLRTKFTFSRAKSRHYSIEV